MEYDKNYSNVHAWLRYNFGAAKLCEHCNKEDKNYNWALRKGCKYEKILDNFLQLCVSCHRKYDFDPIAHREKSKKLLGRRNPHTSKKIIMLSGIDKVVFDSIAIASEVMGINAHSISNCLTKRSKTAGKKKWEYLT